MDALYECGYYDPPDPPTEEELAQMAAEAEEELLYQIQRYLEKRGLFPDYEE
jgi:hypothetical protein